MQAKRLDYITFKDTIGILRGQVMSCRFEFSDSDDIFYYVVSPSGKEWLVLETNIETVTPWNPAPELDHS